MLTRILKNNRGVALITMLLMLSALSLLAAGAVVITNIDLQMAGSVRGFLLFDSLLSSGLRLGDRALRAGPLPCFWADCPRLRCFSDSLVACDILGGAITSGEDKCSRYNT